MTATLLTNLHIWDGDDPAPADALCIRDERITVTQPTLYGHAAPRTLPRLAEQSAVVLTNTTIPAARWLGRGRRTAAAATAVAGPRRG